MAFMNELEKKLNSETQCTENGAVGYRTSGKELLDLNFAVSSMRNWDENEICKAYTKAYYENPLLAVKWLFYLRDIRGNGMGERRAFRICFKWLVENHFDNVRALVELIPEYGRYDDWINPIYIERMTLNEKDERMAYLNYLTNLYSKKNIRMDADNQPEYAGGSDDLLEQKYLGEYVPIQDDAFGIWCVQTGHGFESGDINYIASEFSGTGLIYHFMHNGEMDHVHEFESVLFEILKDPEHVDIVTDYGEYSDQEIQMVKGIKRAAEFVQAHHRPMTNAELRKNRAEIKNKGEDDYGNSVQGNQAIFGKKH